MVVWPTSIQQDIIFDIACIRMKQYGGCSPSRRMMPPCGRTSPLQRTLRRMTRIANIKRCRAFCYQYMIVLALTVAATVRAQQPATSTAPATRRCAGVVHCEFVQSSANAQQQNHGHQPRYICAYAQNPGTGETLGQETTVYTICSLLVPDTCLRGRRRPILTLRFDELSGHYEFVHCGTGSEVAIATAHGAERGVPLTTPMFLLPGGVRSAGGPAAWWKAVLERFECRVACSGRRSSVFDPDGCFARAASPPPPPAPCSVDPEDTGRPECRGEDGSWIHEPNKTDLVYVGDVCRGLQCDAELRRLRGAFAQCS